MHKSLVICSSSSLKTEFERCCKEYDTLWIAVAWCGDPNQTLPYNMLVNFKGTIIATVGYSFHHTHPDAIQWFQDIGTDVRLFRETAELFHPKVYLFRRQDCFALFIGSSNFTYSGFYANHEVNLLIQGNISDGEGVDLVPLEETLAKWRTAEYSFYPSKKWLNQYRKKYESIAANKRKIKIHSPSGAEDEISIASWIQHASWSVFYAKILDGLKQRSQDASGYHAVLDAAAQAIPIPWATQYFKDIDKRRIMGGIKPYGWLGHVASSGMFRGLLANGQPEQWEIIVRTMNTVAILETPLPWLELINRLEELIALGPSMKVWGRLLCLIRPDLYCTVSAPTVRRNLSKTIGVPQNRFDQPEGYVELIKLIHGSPWFNSLRPTNNEEAAVWQRRAAFLDAVLY